MVTPWQKRSQQVYSVGYNILLNDGGKTVDSIYSHFLDGLVFRLDQVNCHLDDTVSINLNQILNMQYKSNQSFKEQSLRPELGTFEQTANLYDKSIQKVRDQIITAVRYHSV